MATLELLSYLAWAVLVATTSLHVVTAVQTSVLDKSWAEILTVEGVVSAAKEFWEIFGPGGKLHPAYFLEHKGHLVLEGLLLGLIVYLFLQNSFKPKVQAEEPLTDKEVEQLCKEWEPEPLVPVNDLDVFPEPPVITGTKGIYVTVDGKKVLNLAAANYLNLSNSAKLKTASKTTVEKYGVGSCGPRGFYGTIDVHLHLESQLAKFMGTERAIIYSYDIATVSSVIPAFSSRKDIIVADEYCSYPIQSGLVVSRAAVHYFKHNDMEDLERVLKGINAKEKKARKPITRRLIVVEGIYANTGDLAPLDKLYHIKEKYKYRLVVEESYSFGVLGATGRGACEHFGLMPEQVEIICASMSASLGSVGGFCVGDNTIVEHQRLSGLGYCFSASLPPYLATAASVALDELQEGPRPLLTKLASTAKQLRTELRSVTGLKQYDAEAISPVVHLHLAKPSGNSRADRAVLQKIADHVLQQSNILLAVSHYSNLDTQKVPNSIKLYANTGMEDKDVTAVVSALQKAVKAVL